MPHHLLDIVDPNESYSLSCYVEAAHRVAAEIKQRGHRVLFVGGTPLYLKALFAAYSWDHRPTQSSELPWKPT